MVRWLTVMACALLTHAAAFGAGFVWLDHAHIEDRLAIVPLARAHELFLQGFAGTGYYRPLMALSLSLDAWVSQGPFVFHATTLAFHAAASVMVLAAAEALGLSRRASTMAGILFAVHPLAELPANLIAFRSEAMVAVALLGLVVAHLRGKAIWAAVALLAGALTKENALGLAPLFIVAMEIARPAQGARRRLLVAEGGAWAVALGLRMAFAPGWRAAHEALGWGDAIGTRLAALAKGAGALAFPVDRRICDAFRVTHAWEPLALLGLAVAAAIVRLAWTRRAPALLFALAMVPSLQLVPVMRWWSPHYYYVPLAFAAMLAAERLARLQSARARWAVMALPAVLAALSLWNGARFRTDATLWEPEVKAEAACREGHFYLAEIDREAGRLDAAAKRYEAALAPRPRMLAYVDRTAALENLGTVLIGLRRFGDARRVFRSALAGVENESMKRELTHNLAGAALAEGDAAEAEQLLGSETARSDAFPQSILLRAQALQKLGRTSEAEALRARLPR